MFYILLSFLYSLVSFPLHYVNGVNKVMMMMMMVMILSNVKANLD